MSALFVWNKCSFAYTLDRALDWFEEDDLQELKESLDGLSQDERDKRIAATYLIRLNTWTQKLKTSFLRGCRGEQYTQWETQVMNASSEIVSQIENEDSFVPVWDDAIDFYAVLEYWRVGEELASDYTPDYDY